MPPAVDVLPLGSPSGPAACRVPHGAPLLPFAFGLSLAALDVPRVFVAACVFWPLSFYFVGTSVVA